MVCLLAFYSDDVSLSPAEAYSCSVKLLLKRTKINKMEAVDGPIVSKNFLPNQIILFQNN